MMSLTFTQRGLLDWTERVKQHKEQGCWIPQDAAGSGLSTRWGLGAAQIGHSGGVLPGMIFNSRSQLMMFGVHGARHDRFFHRNGRLLSVLLCADAPEPPTKEATKPRGKGKQQVRSPSPPPPPPATGAMLDGAPQRWRRCTERDAFIISAESATLVGEHSANLLCKGPAGRMKAALKDESPVRLTLEVHMALSEETKAARDRAKAQKGKDLDNDDEDDDDDDDDDLTESWYIYLGLYKVTCTHPGYEVTDTTKGGAAEVVWQQDFDMKGLPGESLSWQQVMEVAKSMTHNSALGTVNADVWKATTPQHQIMITAHTWDHLPALPPLPPKRCRPSEAAGGGAGSDGKSGKGKGINNAATGKGQQKDKASTSGNGNAVDPKTGKKLKTDKAPDGKPSELAVVQELTWQEEERLIHAWKHAFRNRKGLHTRDLADKLDQLLPLPVVMDPNLHATLQDSLQRQLKMIYVTDYVWAPGSLTPILRQLQRLEDVTRAVAKQPLPGGSVTEGEITDEVAAAWWRNGRNRPFCASQLQSHILNERYLCAGHKLTPAEVEKELPLVCPFDERGVMAPDYPHHPHVVHQCNQDCNRLGVLCGYNTQVLNGPTLPLEIYGDGKTRQLIVRCAVPISAGRFVCCVLGALTTLQQLGHLSVDQAVKDPSGQLVPLTHAPGSAVVEGGVIVPQLVIDMRSKGNVARFIRHSDQPNLRMQAVWAGGARSMSLYYLALCANKYIPAHTELTFNRKGTPWVDLFDPAVEDVE